GLLLFQIPKALVYMPSISRQFSGLLGHRTCYYIVFFGNLLYTGLEKDSPISGFQNIAILDGRLGNPGTGLDMQSFQRNAKTLQLIEKSVKEILVFGHSQNRVPKHTGSQSQGCLKIF